MRYKDKAMQKPSPEALASVNAAILKATEEHRPVRILFVCLGNICRSPAAEGMMRQKAKEAGISIELDSAGFYGGHAGDLPDRRMREAAWQRGLRLDHHSRTVRPSDYDYFDLLVGMDDNNINSLLREAPTLEAEQKIIRMSDFAVDHPSADSIPDPDWEGAAGFHLVLDLLDDACEHLLIPIRSYSPDSMSL